MGQQSYCWDLVDIEGDSKAWFASLGIPMGDSIPAAPHAWHPSSYGLPREAIDEEAIQDVNEKLREFVFPVLEIA